MFRGQSTDADWGKARLETLSDGVFAIAMTILVFNVKLPDEIKHGDPEAKVLNAVVNTWPQLLAYIISFVILGAMWMGHHNIFHALRKVDRGTIWMNMFYLLWIGLMPFSTSVYSMHAMTRTGLLTYWINVFLAAAFMTLLWSIVSRKPDLMNPELTPTLKRNISVRTWVMPVVSIGAIVGTLFNPMIGLYATWILPLAYRLVTRITNRRMETATAEEKAFEQENA